MTTTKFTFYCAKDGWRWRAKRTGKIVAESGEAYRRRGSAERSLKRLIASLFDDAYTIDVEQ